MGMAPFYISMFMTIHLGYKLLSLRFRFKSLWKEDDGGYKSLAAINKSMERYIECSRCFNVSEVKIKMKYYWVVYWQQSGSERFAKRPQNGRVHETACTNLYSFETSCFMKPWNLHGKGEEHFTKFHEMPPRSLQLPMKGPLGVLGDMVYSLHTQHPFVLYDSYRVEIYLRV